MSSVHLSDAAGRSWVRVRPGDVSASGYVRPRLLLRLHAQTAREKRLAEIHVLKGRLSFANEQLGEGLLTGVSLNFVERELDMEIPIERTALQFVVDGASGDQIDLTLDLSGWMRVKREPTEDDPPYHMEHPEPGDWGFMSFGTGQQTILRLQIARSDWFTRVMDPVGTLSYVITEIPLSKGLLAGELKQTLNQLREAERKYATGDDAEVFFRCRAALEALPGAPKNVFAALADEDEAACMNALMKETVNYLHHGRHTVAEGTQRGEFPVDHGDARFALALTRLLIAQTSRRLNEGSG